LIMARKTSIAMKREAKRWFTENRDAVMSINSFLERHGLLASKLRYGPGQHAGGAAGRDTDRATRQK
jgi:Post-segregation antitoxin CcdA